MLHCREIQDHTSVLVLCLLDVQKRRIGGRDNTLPWSHYHMNISRHLCRISSVHKLRDKSSFVNLNSVI